VPLALARHERYRVVRLVGQGGMGAVYEAEHLVMQRAVALKVIRSAYTAQAGAVERFRREARVAARLSHPNIVAAFDAEHVGDMHFLVMEYVEGTTLARLVKERGPLPVREACEYVRQAALGLQHAHERGLVHRDVKPGNLMLTPDGTVKVVDFGLAALAPEGGAGGLTETDALMGTPDYMAPEQAEDARTADIRADVYSLGCTLYYLLTGRIPYPAPTLVQKILAHREQALPSLRQTRPEVPRELAGVMARMLAKKPADRYQTPAEVAAALTPFAQPPAAQPPRQRRRVLVAVALAALFVGMVAAGAVVYRIQTDQGELVITTESDDVKVVVTQGGKLVDVIDTKTDKQITLALRSGVYELELKGAPEGLKLNIDKATLTRGKQTLAKIERVEKQPPEPVGEVRRFEGHKGCVWAVAWSGDARRAYSAGEDNLIRVWDTATGAEVGQFEGHQSRVLCLALSPDGRILLSGSSDATVRIWDTASGKELRRLDGVTGPQCWAVAFSPDGKYAIAQAGYNETTVHFGLWEVASGKGLHSYAAQANCVAFHPDGRHVLLGGAAGWLKLLEIDTGRQVRSFEGHTNWVRRVAISADGRRALSVSGGAMYDAPNPQPAENDSTVRCWGLEEGAKSCVFRGHTHSVFAGAFVPGQNRILSGSADKTIRLWDLDTEKEVFRWHVEEPVVCLAASPDGRYALSSGTDGSVRLWRLPDPRSGKRPPG
jgi:tRNA A-37 threonylcarbamoyl transferase component Bud32